MRAVRGGTRLALCVGMMTQRFREAIGLMLVLISGALAPAAIAADATTPRTCGEQAAAYDRKADEYAAAAERYRAWARAEDMFGGSPYESAWELARQADRLDAAARQSRARAAESRSREDSTALSSVGCAGKAPTGRAG
jgi:hypothetical protein